MYYYHFLYTETDISRKNFHFSKTKTGKYSLDVTINLGYFRINMQISACKTGNLEQVKACIKAGVKPNYIDRLDPVSYFSVSGELELIGATLVRLDWTDVG